MAFGLKNRMLVRFGQRRLTRGVVDTLDQVGRVRRWTSRAQGALASAHCPTKLKPRAKKREEIPSYKENT